MKMKRIFDDQLLAANRAHERKFADMAESFTEEVERYNGLFGDSQKDLLYWKNMFVDLDTKFKEYVTKSERYIKEKDTQLAELQQEAQEMAYKYENHGKIFKEEKDRADKFEKLFSELKQPYDDIKKEAHRLKLNLVKYEQKYGFIDIGKLHEQVAQSKTLYEAAKKESASFHKDLLEIRKRIMDLTQKFDRGNSADGGKKRKKKRNDEEKWKGSEDVEKLSAIFTTYLTSPSNFVKAEPGEESPATMTNAQRDGGAAANNP